MRSLRARDLRPPFWSSVFAALCLLVATNDLHAQPSNRRRFNRLVQQAGEAYNRNEPDVAINLLEQAYTINPNQILLYNIGRAHELAGRLERALEYYDRFLAEHPPEDQAQLGREARAGIQSQIAARRRSEQASQQQDNPPPPPPPQARLRWVDQPRRLRAGHATLIFSGAALAIAGGVMGVLALNSSTSFAATNDPAQRAGLQDRGNIFVWGANIGIPLGATLSLSGLLWWATQPTRIQVEDTSDTSTSSTSNTASAGGM